MKTAFRTDVGQIRSINEDRAVITELPNGWLLAVLADGMGGHQAGDVASQSAVDRLASELAQLESGRPDGELRDHLRETIARANAYIHAQSVSRPELAGMGTTLVAALASPERVFIAHVGDSRAYLLRGDELVQLTEDHSLVNELVRSGQISPEEAKAHPQRNVLTRALGTEPFVAPDLHELEWSAGDLLLLCTDGLTNMINDADILGTLKSGTDLDAMAERLVEQALEAGGSDNVSVILVRNEKEDGGEGGDR
jgi:serine/threonine protein phosphatase PrpC